jgi:hypothetical protein
MKSAETDAAFDFGVERLFELFQTGFDRELVLELGQLPDIDLSRAETELHLLDLFAVYLAIRRNESPTFIRNGAILFERVCIQVLTWWSAGWDARDDVVAVLNGRFAAYNRLLEPCANLHDITQLIGLFCTVIIQGGGRVFADDDRAAPETFVELVRDSAYGDNLLRTTAEQVFRTRFEAVSRLLDELDQCAWAE